MWRTSSAFLLVAGSCALFIVVFLMKGTLSYGQVPAFNFGRVRPRHPVPFQETFRLSEDGKLISLAPDINLFQNSDSDDRDEATPNDSAVDLRAGRSRPFRVYRPYYERADWPKPDGVSPFDSVHDDGATHGDDSVNNRILGDDSVGNHILGDDSVGNHILGDDSVGNHTRGDDSVGNHIPGDDSVGNNTRGDDSVGSSVDRDDGGGGLPSSSDNGDKAAPIDHSAGSSVDREDGDRRVDRGYHDEEEYERLMARLLEAHTCRHESIKLYARWPGSKVPFYCQNVDAVLLPGVLDVFSGSSCTGAPVPLSTLVPGAELLHRPYADGDVWTVSVKHLPAADTTLCYQCQVTDEETASVCKVIIIVKAGVADAAACKVPALLMPTLIFSAFLGALVLTVSP